MKCKECGEPIGKDEIRIFIPECYDVGMFAAGHFHRDCRIYAEAIEDGWLFEDGVTRMFRVLTAVMMDRVRDAELAELSLSIMNKAMAKLNEEVVVAAVLAKVEEEAEALAAVTNAGGTQ